MENLLSVADVSRILGVSIQTLANWRVGNPKIPFVKIGTRVLYRPTDIEYFIEKNRIKPK